MNQKTPISRSFYLASLAAVSWFALIGPAQAQATIKACVNNASGTIRVLGANASCQNNETEITLSGQASAGPEVTDSQGKTVGRLLMPDYVIQTLDGIPVYLPVTEDGFYQSSAAGFQFYHAQANCGGPRYYLAGDLPRRAQVNNDTAYFAGNPAQTLTIMSVETFSPDQSLSQAGSCYTYYSPYTLQVGPLDGVALAGLGLAPPFSVQ